MSLSLDILRGISAVVIVLGIVVVFYALKGFKKTRSYPLVFLALGFAFITIGAAVAGLLYEFGAYDMTTVMIVEEATELAGFMMIVYSILGSKK